MVRIALISDVQGNAVALEAALAAIKKQGVDGIVCLGDLVTGPEPCVALELLRQHQVVSARGNMDESVLHPEPTTGKSDFERHFAEIDQWCLEQLSAADHDYLAQLPLCRHVALGPLHMLCCHGSPSDPNAAIDATTPEAELDHLLGTLTADIFATGNMHTPLFRRYKTKTLLNPGSIGLPYGARQPMPPRAEFAIVENVGSSLTVTFAQADFDFKELRRRMLASVMPHPKWYADLWLA